MIYITFFNIHQKAKSVFTSCLFNHFKQL